MNRLLGMRPEDRRVTWAGFVTLFVIVAAHGVLETARDALFLADLPVGRLPWAYLGIASLAFLVGRLTGRLLVGRSSRRALAGMLLAGGAGTAALWQIVAAASPASLMALYIWTGVLASIVVSQFWIQLGSRMDVGQAKRAYGLIAAGGMLGATVGALLAGAALTVTGPRHLLALAAVLFAVAGALAAQRTASAEAPSDVEPPVPAEGPALRDVRADPYLRRLLVLAIVGPVVAMGIDFVFKSIVIQHVPRAGLAPFFARYHAVVNGAALAFQVLAAPRLLQSIGVVRSLCVLPACLGIAAAAGVAGTAAFPAALLLRGADGVLRHSLHRAATEILFLPLSAAARAALRRLAESIGQRGGQVVGSVLILLALRMGATPRELAAGVAVLCALWLFGYLRLQHHYLERFRSQLGELSAVPDAAIPALDLGSLETLVAALSAPEDAEVLAALDLLEAYGRTRLVPPLILYHPSAAVVVRALALFEETRRPDVQEIRRRLLRHSDPVVRAAALRSVVAEGTDRATVRRILRTDPSPVVRRTALALWIGFEEASEAELREAVSDLVTMPDPESRLAVARTLGELPARVLVRVARALLEGATAPVRRAVACALATDPDESRMSLLTELVASPECRAFARAGLRALGAPALEHLAMVLENPETPARLRRHLPRSISAFGSARAAEILVTQLAREQDGAVIHKILRGLGRILADDPAVPVDRPTLMTVAERRLGRIITLLAYRVAWDVLRDVRAGGSRGTGAEGAAAAQALDDDLVVTLLAEKERRGVEHVCRVLQILETGEDFATIYAALGSDAPAARAGARELIGHVLAGGCRDGLLALTDSLAPPERLQAAATALPVPIAERALAVWRLAQAQAAEIEESANAVVREMCNDGSVVLASVARYEANALTARATAEAHRVAS